MTYVYVIIAIVIVGLIIWMVARKKGNGPSDNLPQGPSEPPAVPPEAPPATPPNMPTV